MGIYRENGSLLQYKVTTIDIDVRLWIDKCGDSYWAM